MRFSQLNPLLLLSLLGLPVVAVWESDKAEEPDINFQEDVLDFLDEYCLRCHEGEDAEADLDFSLHFSEQEAREHPNLYWDAAWKVWDHAMPPPRRLKQPTLEERARFLAWVDAEDGLGYQPPMAAPVLRRMNRSIYRRSILHLFGVEVPKSIWETLPSDEAGDGFDNIGASLTMSDDAVLKYLDAAELIADLAVVDFNPPTELRTWIGSELDAPKHQAQTAALYSHGGATANFQAPRAGRYIFRVRAWGDQAGEEPCKMDMAVNGASIKTVEISSPVGEETESLVHLELDKGEHLLAAQFMNDYWAPNAPEGTANDRNLYILGMEMEGPLDPLPPTNFQIDLKNRYPLLLAPKEGKEQRLAFTSELLKLAWRRKPTKKELRRYTKILEDQTTWENMVRLVCTAAMTSPHFLFESTSRPKRFEPSQKLSLSNEELATKLSFFLWSSVPSIELSERMAHKDFATDDANLKTIMDWMLAQPQSEALAEDFAGQSFRIRGLLEHEVDEAQFPTLTPALLLDMQKETHLLFKYIIQEDLNLNELLTADYTFLNQRLANHYGYPWQGQNEEWEIHNLGETQSRGILGHASVLTVTSMATRTSPVRRGKWIMENIMGASPPPPPADAGLLDESNQENSEATLRERLASHRNKPQCIPCHKVMDPLGFSLEHYDPIGRWRETERGRAVDAGGELPDGTQLAGLLDIVKTLEERDHFPRLFLSRLTSYALGRSLTSADRPLLQNIMNSMDSNKPTVREAIYGIVLSDAFRTHSTPNQND